MLFFIDSIVVHLPTSKTLSLNWNYGSLLFMILVFQIATGLFLTFYYTADGTLAFLSVQYIMYESFFGWLFRIFHFNGASFFFFIIFLHFFKALFFMSYRLSMVWVSGLSILLLLMAEAFMGYVLVWAQMSFWATIVITSLLSVIPFFGNTLVGWVWGGFNVSSATLKFFFVFHFLIPWLLLVFLVFHVLFLHNYGSTSKMFYLGDIGKIEFFSYYWVKDFYNLILFLAFLIFCFLYPFVLGDPEMFLECNPMVSPVHIVPEWYFLFAYAILRAVPNKMVGVILLLLSIVLFYTFIFFNNNLFYFDNFNIFFVFLFIFNSVILSWLGQCLVEYPFLLLSGIISFLYFFFMLLIYLNYMAGFILFF